MQIVVQLVLWSEALPLPLVAVPFTSLSNTSLSLFPSLLLSFTLIQINEISCQEKSR